MNKIYSALATLIIVFNGSIPASDRQAYHCHNNKATANSMCTTKNDTYSNRLRSFFTKKASSIKNSFSYRSLPILFAVTSALPTVYCLYQNKNTAVKISSAAGISFAYFTLLSYISKQNHTKNCPSAPIKKDYIDQFKKEIQRCSAVPNLVSISATPENTPYGDAYCYGKTIFLNSANLLKIDGKNGDLKENESDQNAQIMTLFDENKTPSLNFTFRHELAHAHHNDIRKRNFYLCYLPFNLCMMAYMLMDITQKAANSIPYSCNFSKYLRMTTTIGFLALFKATLSYSYSGMIANAKEYEADMFAVKHSTAKECYAYANYIASLINQEEEYISSLKFPFSLFPIPVFSEHPSMRDRCEYLKACAKEKEEQVQKEKVAA